MDKTDQLIDQHSKECLAFANPILEEKYYGKYEHHQIAALNDPDVRVRFAAAIYCAQLKTTPLYAIDILAEKERQEIGDTIYHKLARSMYRAAMKMIKDRHDGLIE